MLTIPSMEYQAALRLVCSERRYHIWTIAMKVGATEASKDPRRNLAAIKPPKSRAAVIPHRTAPQQKTIVAQNFPIKGISTHI